MKPFNLAEEKIEQRLLCRREIDKRVRILAALLVLDLFALAGFVWCRSSVAGEVAAIEAELANTQQRCVSIKRNLLAYKTRSGQRKWHAQLAQSSSRWLSLLDAILYNVPNGVWLSRVETSESGNAVTVEGQALSMNLVSEFMRSIKECRAFSDVQLNSAQVAGSLAATFGVAEGQRGRNAIENTYNSGGSVVVFAVQAKLSREGESQAAQAAQAVPQVQGSP